MLGNAVLGIKMRVRNVRNSAAHFLREHALQVIAKMVNRIDFLTNQLFKFLLALVQFCLSGDIKITFGHKRLELCGLDHVALTPEGILPTFNDL